MVACEGKFSSSKPLDTGRTHRKGVGFEQGNWR